ncbi:hypothetical protein N0V83_005768 [Neocucurbitaria cava]|uniref:Uncharacterized protein n=1 Tax=Neocucurbitaria cava TaxID=798079 RepID=A0A9W8Y8L7_9PLEO|nr:hypothetical protein N0V83_005768 [Neocucurbitaria cava]
MPPTARIPTVEFRSLLSPPVRVPLRAIRSLYRPQLPPIVHHVPRPSQCLAQCRSLHLYKTAKAKTALGMHKVLTFSPYKVTEPTASPHKVQLVEDEHDPITAGKDITLQVLYDNHVKPGHMLYFTKTPQKAIAKRAENLEEDAIPPADRQFALVKAHTRFVHIAKSQKGAQFGALKIVIVSLMNPVHYFKLALDRAYQFILAGSPVEFRLRLCSSPKLSSKQDRHKPYDPAVWPWLHDRFPHLRPDFVLRGMPEGTVYLVEPVSDGRRVQWVMARPVDQMPKVDLNARLVRVKTTVGNLVRQGKLRQVPKGLKEGLEAPGVGRGWGG